jgi:hypothetical protein
MLENDKDPLVEGSGTMLFQTLKSLLMLIPQSTCYNLLRDRLVSTSRFRQSVIAVLANDEGTGLSKETEMFVNRVLDVRAMHCEALWETIRAESLESVKADIKLEEEDVPRDEGADKREWLGYGTKEEERVAQARFREEKRRRQAGVVNEEDRTSYNDLESMATEGEGQNLHPNKEEDETWKDYWTQNNASQ